MEAKQVAGCTVGFGVFQLLPGYIQVKIADPPARADLTRTESKDGAERAKRPWSGSSGEPPPKHLKSSRPDHDRPEIGKQPDAEGPGTGTPAAGRQTQDRVPHPPAHGQRAQAPEDDLARRNFVTEVRKELDWLKSLRPATTGVRMHVPSCLGLYGCLSNRYIDCPGGMKVEKRDCRPLSSFFQDLSPSTPVVPSAYNRRKTEYFTVHPPLSMFGDMIDVSLHPARLYQEARGETLVALPRPFGGSVIRKESHSPRNERNSERPERNSERHPDRNPERVERNSERVERNSERTERSTERVERNPERVDPDRLKVVEKVERKTSGRLGLPYMRLIGPGQVSVASLIASQAKSTESLRFLLSLPEPPQPLYFQGNFYVPRCKAWTCSRHSRMHHEPTSGGVPSREDRAFQAIAWSKTEPLSVPPVCSCKDPAKVKRWTRALELSVNQNFKSSPNKPPTLGLSLTETEAKTHSEAGSYTTTAVQPTDPPLATPPRPDPHSETAPVPMQTAGSKPDDNKVDDGKGDDGKGDDGKSDGGNASSKADNGKPDASSEADVGGKDNASKINDGNVEGSKVDGSTTERPPEDVPMQTEDGPVREARPSVPDETTLLAVSSQPGVDEPVEGTQAEGTNAEGAPAEGTQTEGTHAEGAQAEGAQAEGTQAEGRQTEGGKAEDGQAEGSQAEGSQVKGSQAEGSQAEASKPGVPDVGPPTGSKPVAEKTAVAESADSGSGVEKEGASSGRGTTEATVPGGGAAGEQAVASGAKAPLGHPNEAGPLESKVAVAEPELRPKQVTGQVADSSKPNSSKPNSSKPVDGWKPGDGLKPTVLPAPSPAGSSPIAGKVDPMAELLELEEELLYEAETCKTCGGLTYYPFSFIQIPLSSHLPTLQQVLEVFCLPPNTDVTCDGPHITATITTKSPAHEWRCFQAVAVKCPDRPPLIYDVCGESFIPGIPTKPGQRRPNEKEIPIRSTETTPLTPPSHHYLNCVKVIPGAISTATPRPLDFRTNAPQTNRLSASGLSASGSLTNMAAMVSGAMVSGAMVSGGTVSGGTVSGGTPLAGTPSALGQDPAHKPLGADLRAPVAGLRSNDANLSITTLSSRRPFCVRLRSLVDMDKALKIAQATAPPEISSHNAETPEFRTALAEYKEQVSVLAQLDADLETVKAECLAITVAGIKR
ncbi:hypothetical protein GNI_118450 [Gregarina niphandrodes]|uniref:Uncharacterized protein n=1 Tax=Gregarina niphandrodes TaxID=110365 RepID=A0A023B355_GRENI|nr:hypothetical protein GNI_118450 [Gregarina niphandrodes]EZG55085.1 hypothetical protein GNI_118450 [Gregarina niphandrodes]|eukprot:XP_011131788.1 hypothetical protein GNI_118450 [Gregarina niphandrodes]